MTVLIVEQDVQIALEQADRAYVLDLGQIVISGPASDLLADPRVQEAYLGIDSVATPSELVPSLVAAH